MCAHGVHCSTQAGIAGKASGATSVVLNSGYTGDDEVPNQMYVQSKEHTFDQSWNSRGNAGLRICWKSGSQVRVCRGWKTRYGPARGYRYDGCWMVVHAWQARAPDGFLRCRFHLIRLPGQPVDPEHGMPELSPRLLEALERVARVCQPKAHEGEQKEPRSLAGKEHPTKDSRSEACGFADARPVADGALARKRKRQEKDGDEMLRASQTKKPVMLKTFNMSNGRAGNLSRKGRTSVRKTADRRIVQTNGEMEDEPPIGPVAGDSEMAGDTVQDDGNAGDDAPIDGVVEVITLVDGMAHDGPHYHKAVGDSAVDDEKDDKVLDNGKSDDDSLSLDLWSSAICLPHESDNGALAGGVAANNAFDNKSDDELMHLILQLTVKKEEVDEGEAQVYA
ncbi:PUA-like domain-containing protein [Schizophyllum commune]